MTLALAGERTRAALPPADERIRNRLETQSGVGQVSIFGGQRARCRWRSTWPACGLRLTLQQVTQALGAENVDLPGGQAWEPGRNLNLRVDKFRPRGHRGHRGQHLPSGGQVRARRGHGGGRLQDQTLLSRVNGKDAVGITVTKQASAVTNTAACGRRSPALEPRGAELEVITDDSVLHPQPPHRRQHPDRGRPAHRPGAAGLPHSWRSTVIVLLAIPTSLIATFGVMWLQWLTLNFLTTLALT